ncbi:P-loop containing nucleoside triphosphate hydrolase protein [Parathielavia hyrcaniae]|uniref:P-loop containing nucleoside triphosphate hydrolase protein n=1 Tax=Parathielavia hyrcaniae TaxID=113614 RepID=A0AAN6T2U3_9PEZI|nr:P-loop containing nucleoside triphosphate hydrolase protein [Parathielavia hyrcaniae]
MSPRERPIIPLQMAGGRPLPGSQRSGTPTPWKQRRAPEEPGSSIVGSNPARASDFAVGSAAALGNVAPPITPVGGSEDGARAAGDRGHLLFETSSRMGDWLRRLQVLSLERQEGEEKEGEDIARAAAAHAFKVEESARLGNKRSCPTNDDDEEEMARSQPATKRSRLGAVFQRTASRAGRHKADSTTTTSPTSPLDFAPDHATPTTPLTAINVATPSPGPRPFSPFESLLSRVSGTGASADAASSVVPSRTIKICLVGDVAAGKTAFFKGPPADSFSQTSPSLAPEYKAIAVRADDDSIVSVELWVFPGIVAGERPGPLLSTFFHAAIICFSLEDKENLANVAEVWKPKIDASLHDQHIFVLGLKRDLRPTHPTLGLDFLPTTEPVTTAMGQQATRAIHASGYGECSALNLDNVQAAMTGIVNHVVANLEEHERTIGRGRGRGRGLLRARSAVSGFLDRMRLRRFPEGRR